VTTISTCTRRVAIASADKLPSRLIAHSSSQPADRSRMMIYAHLPFRLLTAMITYLQCPLYPRHLVRIYIPSVSECVINKLAFNFEAIIFVKRYSSIVVDKHR
jgi:hypothetical protein